MVLLTCQAAADCPPRMGRKVRARLPAVIDGIRIHRVRGHHVLLDADLAALYGVTTGRLNEAVSRNAERFPRDFMFELTENETRRLISQFAISRPGRGGRRRSLPRAFTEQGVAMLSSVLRSRKAVQTNIAIMRAFVALHRQLGTQEDLTRKISELEAKFDRRFRVVFDAIRELTADRDRRRTHPIGFRPDRSQQ